MPELSDADKKAGKAAAACPTESGEHTVESLTKVAAPDARPHGRAADQGRGARQGRPPTAPPAPASVITVPRRSRSRCAPASGASSAPTSTSTASSTTAPARSTAWPTRSRRSLIQQRERMLDLADDVLHHDARRALPAQPARRGLGSRRAGRRVREQFGFQPDFKGKTPRARRRGRDAVERGRTRSSRRARPSSPCPSSSICRATSSSRRSTRSGSST